MTLRRGSFVWLHLIGDMPIRGRVVELRPGQVRAVFKTRRGTWYSDALVAPWTGLADDTGGPMKFYFKDDQAFLTDFEESCRARTGCGLTFELRMAMQYAFNIGQKSGYTDGYRAGDSERVAKIAAALKLQRDEQ